MPTAKQVQKAINALDNAWKALEPLVGDEPRDSVYTLRADIRRYLEYLEDATWWRKQS